MTRLWPAYLLVGVLVVVGYAASPSRLAQNGVYNLLGLLAVVAILVGVRVHRPVRRAPWFLLAAGQFLWVLGDAWLTVHEQLTGVAPFPSVADLWYLAGYPVLATGLAMLIQSRERQPDRSSLLDALIVTSALGLVLWVLAIEPIVAAGSDSTIGAVVAVAYPVGDIVLLAGVVLLTTSSAGHTASVRMLMAALVCVVVADTLYSAASGSTLDRMGPSDDLWLEYLWLASYLFWGAAALHPSMAVVFLPAANRRATFGLRRLLAIAAACVLAPGVLLLERAATLDAAAWVVALGSGVVFLLALVRLRFAMNHVASLSEQRELLQQELAFLATHDPLTELPNRAEAMLQLRLALGRARLANSGVAVLVVDLDRFGEVNDVHGRQGGDEVLRSLATRLASELRGSGLVARLDGDQFLVVVPGPADPVEALRGAERLIGTTVRPIPLSVGGEVAVDASVGLVLSDGVNADADGLVHAAELAVRRAKRAGGGVAELSVPALETETEDADADRVGAVRRAIAADELMVLYQPVVSLPDRRVLGVESLVRLVRPDGGLVPPSEFIPLAETSDLIVELDNWMLDAVARQIALWSRQENFRELAVAVNISGRHINQPRLLDDVVEALARHQADPHRLVLEVTETVPVEDGAPVANLHRLRRMGIRIALDDFGTGHNTMDTLGRLPLDIVKIDRSFLDDSSRARPQMLRLLVRAARGYRLPLVGEGVERETQVAVLESLQVGAAQGYLFGRPMPADQVEQHLADEAVSPSAAAP